MKKTLLLVAFPAAFVAGFLVVLLIADEAPLTPESPTCEIALGEPLEQAVGSAFGKGKWTIYSFDGTARAPTVLARELRGERLAVPAAGGCELDVRAELEPDSRGLDWRIGRVALDFAPFRGRTIRARFLIKAEQEARFESASVYVYDGATVSGVAVKTLNRDWTPFTVTHTVQKDAKAFELWFRLLLDRPGIFPERNKIEFAVILDEVPPGAAAAPQTVDLFTGPDFSEATCPLSYSEAFDQAVGEDRPLEEWVVYRHDGKDPAPRVEARLVAEERVTPGPLEYCVLDLKGAPEVPSDGLDWRIGHAVSVEGLRGKTVRFAAKLRALAPTRFDSAMLYLYNGERVEGVPIETLDTQWQELSVIQTVPEDATTVQAWLRLIFGKGTIVPGASVIQFAPSLDLVEQQGGSG